MITEIIDWDGYSIFLNVDLALFKRCVDGNRMGFALHHQALEKPLMLIPMMDYGDRRKWEFEKRISTYLFMKKTIDFSRGCLGYEKVSHFGEKIYSNKEK